MSEMIRRVVEAITAAFEGEGRVFDGGQAELLARAAIEAMREPTAPMVEAAGGPCVNLERVDDPAYEPQLVWEAMIDEALK